MGHQLRAVLGKADLLTKALADHEGAILVPLPQDFLLVPMTSLLFDLIGNDSSAPVHGFAFFPSRLDPIISAWSMSGQVAYLETDYFGGVGQQSAALWQHGKMTMGPLSTRYNSEPISLVLREMRVTDWGYADEFDALGLGKFRSMARWEEFDESAELGEDLQRDID